MLNSKEAILPSLSAGLAKIQRIKTKIRKKVIGGKKLIF